MATEAAPRTIDNPDAAEFTRRHSEFYLQLRTGNKDAARLAFNSLRSWAWARCRHDAEFLTEWREANKDNILDLAEMDRLATLMKCVWHDQHMWAWKEDEYEELEAPLGDSQEIVADA